VWVVTLNLPAGLGGSTLTVGATFDGVDVVEPRSIPIGTDAWTANYPASVAGGCAVAAHDKAGELGLAVAAAAVAGRRRRRRRQGPT
jgi:MYXO-CTERM domain-containing protein